MSDNLARLRVTLDVEPYLSRVEIEGTGKIIPASQIEIRQNPDPKGFNCAVLYVPLDFVDVALVQSRRK